MELLIKKQTDRIYDKQNKSAYIGFGWKIKT